MYRCVCAQPRLWCGCVLRQLILTRAAAELKGECDAGATCATLYVQDTVCTLPLCDDAMFAVCCICVCCMLHVCVCCMLCLCVLCLRECYNCLCIAHTCGQSRSTPRLAEVRSAFQGRARCWPCVNSSCMEPCVLRSACLCAHVVLAQTCSAAV